MIEVQSLILNSSFPKDLEEVLRIQKEHTKYDVETLVDSIQDGATGVPEGVSEDRVRRVLSAWWEQEL